MLVTVVHVVVDEELAVDDVDVEGLFTDKIWHRCLSGHVAPRGHPPSLKSLQSFLVSTGESVRGCCTGALDLGD